MAIRLRGPVALFSVRSSTMLMSGHPVDLIPPSRRTIKTTHLAEKAAFGLLDSDRDAVRQTTRIHHCQPRKAASIRRKKQRLTPLTGPDRNAIHQHSQHVGAT